MDVHENEKYPEDELKKLRKLVQSDDYKKWVKSETTYFRLAKMSEHLKKPQKEIAYRYLQATWEVEREEGDRPRIYIQRSLEAYEKVIVDKTAKVEDRRIAEFLKGEFLRRLGKFDDAKKHFETLQKQDGFKAEPYPKLIRLELDFITKKDDSPHEIEKK